MFALHWICSQLTSVDDKPLLGFITKAARLFRASWFRCSMHTGQLTIFPRPHAEQEAHYIALLISPHPFEVPVRTHDDLLLPSSKEGNSLTGQYSSIKNLRCKNGPTSATVWIALVRPFDVHTELPTYEEGHNDCHWKNTPHPAVDIYLNVSHVLLLCRGTVRKQSFFFYLFFI